MKLKHWLAGIYRTAENGLLFRTRKNFGLGLTSISDFDQKMQLTECERLSQSKDNSIQELYKSRVVKNASYSRMWKTTKAATMANAGV